MEALEAIKIDDSTCLFYCRIDILKATMENNLFSKMIYGILVRKYGSKLEIYELFEVVSFNT